MEGRDETRSAAQDRYVISDERLDEIRAMVESDEVGRVWLSEGTTSANCAGAIYDLLAERNDRG